MRQLAPGLEFGGDQTSNGLTLLQVVTFLRVEFNHPATGTRCDMDFIDLDRARDRLETRPASA
jgi:hypothetical protein